jgi:hypothetical protein
MTDLEQYDPAGGTLATISSGQLGHFQEWAKAVAVSALLPEALRGKPADVLITLFHGLDLGLKPMQALQLVHVIKGRPSLSAEGMRALLLRDGHGFRVVECDQDKAVVEGLRRGTNVWVSASFTDAQRRAAKLAGANWDAYREDMLLARATTRLCKRYFPDVIGGLDGVEDLLDRQEPVVRPTLGEVAARREDAVVEGELVDDHAVAASVAAAEAAHTRPAAEPALFGDDLPDPPDEWMGASS